MDILALLSGLASQDVYAGRDTRQLQITWGAPEINTGPPVTIRVNTWHEWWSASEFIQHGRAMYDPVMMRQAHAAVAKGIPVFLALLNDPVLSADTLRAALRLLSGFREVGEHVVGAFTTLLDESPDGRATDAGVEAEALFGLGALLTHDAPGWERYARLLTRGAPPARPAARYAAAALATYYPTALPIAGEEPLIEAMLGPDDLDALRLTFGDWPLSVQHDAYHFLGKLGSRRGTDALAVAIERGCENWHILYTFLAAEALLDTAFFGAPVHGRERSVSMSCAEIPSPYPDTLNPFYGSHGGFIGQTFEIDIQGRVEEEVGRIHSRVARDGVAGLSAEERRALEVVAACDPLWRVRHNLLDIYGLPVEREAAEALLRGR